MWAIIKYNKKNFNLMKNDFLSRSIGLVRFYQPKMKIKKNDKNKINFKEISILGNYIFCFNKNFSNDNFIQSLNNIKGLDYILAGCKFSQNEINDFINKCKASHNDEGFISSKFYDLILNKKYKFTSGPFTDMIFNLVKIEKKKVEVVINDLKISLDKNNFNFKSI
tara:strand:+ start:2539 stop:3036 length:498 start_codon:yes stop_codon:yes gene_type:complete